MNITTYLEYLGINSNKPFTEENSTDSYICRAFHLRKNTAAGTPAAVLNRYEQTHTPGITVLK